MQIEDSIDTSYRVILDNNKLDDLIPTVLLLMGMDGSFRGRNRVSGKELTNLLAKGVIEQQGDDVYYKNHYAGTLKELKF